MLCGASWDGAHRDIAIEDGVIAEIGHDLPREGALALDCAGAWLSPALTDLHTHLREPGFEYKEDIETACRAAIAGGFGTVCAMPNTDPAPDKPEVVERILRRASEVGRGVRVLPTCSATVGNARKEPADYAALLEAGCVMVADDPFHILDDGLFRECLTRCAELGAAFGAHCEIPDGDGVSEPKAVERACGLAKDAGAHLHVSHVSTAKGAELILQAKADGAAVTWEVCPHHLALTEDDVPALGGLARVNPCLKTAADARALCERALRGEVDAIATDHAPHAPEEKSRPYAEALAGMLGLEFAMSIAHQALWEVEADPNAWNAARKLLTDGPATALGLEPPRIEVGVEARLALFEFGDFTVEESWIHSRSRNSAYTSRPVRLRPRFTVLGSNAWDHDARGRLTPLREGM